MNITSFGFELEFFYVDTGGNAIMLPSALRPYADACGYLLEARGEPMSNPRDARWMLQSAFQELQETCRDNAVMLENLNNKEIPKDLMRQFRRSFGKGASHSFFARGKCYTSDKPRAGLHIHFGSQRTFNYTDKEGIARTFQYSDQMNIGRIVYLMDQAFAADIKAAKRVPGEYEMKVHGFEYRSLPATANLDVVAEVIADIIAKE